MKRLIIVVLMLAAASWAQAANVTIADLNAQTTPTSSYIMEMENPGVASYKVTMANAIQKSHGLGNWKWAYTDGSNVLTGITVGAAGTFPIFQGTTSAPIVSTLVLPNAGTAYKLPVFSATNTMTELAAAGAAGEILIGKAGAIPAWLAAGGAGKLLMGAAAADPVWTTPTFPNAATTTGAYLRADGTNFIQSTLVLPNAGSAYYLPVFTGANTMGQLAASGTTGQILTAVTGAIPAWSSTLSGLTINLGSGSGVTFSEATATGTLSKGTISTTAPVFTTSVGTPTINLGTAGSVVGKVIMSNATSGSVEISPVAGALGTTVLTAPATSGTLAKLENKISDLAASSSSELAGKISDETGSGALVFGTSPTISGLISTPAEVDGHTDATNLTAAQVSGTVIYNTGQAASDVTLNLPTAAAGYSALFTVGTSRANKWRVRAGANDLIYLIAAAGTIAKGSNNGYVGFVNAQEGQSFACWTIKTDAYDWQCKAIAIGTSTFVAE
jgi:hypothetical protein